MWKYLDKDYWALSPRIIINATLHRIAQVAISLVADPGSRWGSNLKEDIKTVAENCMKIEEIELRGDPRPLCPFGSDNTPSHLL